MIKLPYKNEKGFNIDDKYRIKVITLYNDTALFSVNPITDHGKNPDLIEICKDVETNPLVDIVIATEYGVTTLSKRTCTYIDDVSKECNIVLVVDPFGLTPEQIMSPICRPRKEYLSDIVEPYAIGPYKGTLVIKGSKMDINAYKSEDGVLPQFITEDNLIWQNAYSMHAILTGDFKLVSGDNIYLVDIIMRRMEDMVLRAYPNNFDLMDSIEFGRLMVINIYHDSISISAIIYLKKISNTQIEYIDVNGDEFIIEESEEMTTFAGGGPVFKNIATMLSDLNVDGWIYMNDIIDFEDRVELHGKHYLKLKSMHKKLYVDGDNALIFNPYSKQYEFIDYKIDPKLTEQINVKGLSLYTNKQYLIDTKKMKKSKAERMKDDSIIVGVMEIEKYPDGSIDIERVTNNIERIKNVCSEWDMIFEILTRDRQYFFTLRKKK